MGKKRKVRSKVKSQNFLAFVWVSLSLILVIVLYYSHQSMTGWVVVSGGSTASAGSQTVADPLFGAVKGTLDFTLADDGTIIGTSIGNNYTLYFTKSSISNLSLLKVSPTNVTFSGRLSNVDADGTSTRCNAGAYATTKMYYDANNDGTEQGSEPDVYAITTDDTGCFAMKVRVGINNIFG